MEHLYIEAIKITTEPQILGTLLSTVINVGYSLVNWYLVIKFIKWAWNK